MNEDSLDFCITAPKWQTITFFVGLFLGIALMIFAAVFYCINPTELENFFGILFIGFFFASLSTLGIYVGKKEKFIFENKSFTVIKAFKKSQTAHIDNILRVELRSRGAVIKVSVIGKDEVCLINFLDDGTSFKNNQFVGVLMHYNIPIVNKY